MRVVLHPRRAGLFARHVSPVARVDTGGSGSRREKRCKVFENVDVPACSVSQLYAESYWCAEACLRRAHVSSGRRQRSVWSREGELKKRATELLLLSSGKKAVNLQ